MKKKTKPRKRIKTITVPISKQAAWEAFWTGKLKITYEEDI